MIKRFTFFTLCWIATVCSSAQENFPSITWGESFKNPDGGFELLPLYDSSSFISVSSKLEAWRSRTPIIFKKFSNTGKLLLSNEFGKRDAIPLALKSKLYASYLVVNQIKELLFFVDEIDINTLASKNKEVKLMTVGEGEIHLRVSPDRSKFALFLFPKNNKSSKITCFIFNEDLSSFYQGEIEVIKDKKELILNDAKLENTGDLYISIINCNNLDPTIKNAQSNFSHEILRIGPNGKGQIRIQLENVFITSLRLRTLGNTLICAGYYTRKNISDTKGVFKIIVNLNENKVSTKVVEDFERNFIFKNILLHDFRTLAMDEELPNYQLQHFFIGKDSTAILISEQRFTTSSGKFGSTDHANDILVTSIDKSGKMNWSKTIPKEQVGSFYSEISYKIGFSNKNLFFVFNDREANYLPGATKIKTYPGSKSAIIFTTISPEGNLEKKVINSTNRIIPKSCGQISKNKMILYAEDGSSATLGSLIINQ